MIFILLVARTAFAGEVYFLASGGSQAVTTLDTRELAIVDVAPDPWPYFQNPMEGLAYDPINHLAYAHAGIGDLDLYEYDFSIRRWNNLGRMPVNWWESGVASLSWEPGIGVIGFGINAFPLVRSIYPTYTFFPFDAPLTGADWYPPGGYHLGLHQVTGDFTAAWTNAPAVTLAPWPASIPYSGSGLSAAYDADTGIFWTLGGDFIPGAGLDIVNFGFDPITLEPVAEIFGPWGMGAAGGPDSVPAQTPELLLTGICPGTMYLTLVDGTPGGQAVFASSNRPGQRLVPGGPCAGTATGLTNPQVRAQLTVRSNGLDNTTFEATPAMCGVTLVQAIDIATCMPTQVRTVRTALVQ